MSNPKPPSRTQARAPRASGLSKKDLARQAALGTSTRAARPGSATERLMKAEPHGTRRPGVGGFGGHPGDTGPALEKPVSTYVPKPRAPVMTTRLDQIRQVLDEVLTWRFAADSVVSHWFRAHPKLGIRDRAEVAEVVYAVLRHLRRYRQLAESGVGNAVRR